MVLFSRVISMAILLATLILFCGGWAEAAEYPNKPITLIVGWPAGGITDIAARILAENAAKSLGQPVVVVNKPGGISSISLVSLKTEKPDGYTISTLSSAGMLMPYMRQLPYDVTKDFTAIMGCAENFGGVIVPSESPWKTFTELIEYAKKNPGKMKFATTGVGTVHHLAMERLARQEGIKWVHVPFQGGHAVVTAILGGHVDVAAGSTEWVPHVQAGKIRLLSVYSSKRLPKFPQVPTWLDLGYNIATRITTSLIGPKGIPGPIVNKLHEAFKKGLDDPKFKEALDKYEMAVYYQNPEGLAKDINDYCNQLGKLIVQLGIKQE